MNLHCRESIPFRASVVALIVLTSFVALMSTAKAQDTPQVYLEVGQETLRAFQSGSFEAMKERMSDSFLAQVPLATMNTIPSGYQAQFGKVIDITFDEQRDDPTFAPGTLFYSVMTEGERRAMMRVTLDDAQRIVMWHIGPAVAIEASLKDVSSQLDELEGIVSAIAVEINATAPIFERNPDATLAIGSAFKLYVLAEVLRQCDQEKRNLDDVVSLRAQTMSGPSGRLHNWPVGTPMTVYSLAAMMISESDNTATDHLVDWVGRSEIESRLGSPYRNRAADRNRPFLKTRELFMLQGSGEPWATFRSRYIEGSEQQRHELLDEMKQRYEGEMPQVAAVGGTFRDLEWYASARDLADIMQLLYGDELYSRQSLRDAARGILSINSGIPNSPRDERVAYLGFKGGSEPGVLNLTQYIETTDGRALVVVMTWNNSDGAADEASLVNVFQTLRAAALDEL
jgi:Beta-lactamase enzyme family